MNSCVCVCVLNLAIKFADGAWPSILAILSPFFFFNEILETHGAPPNHSLFAKRINERPVLKRVRSVYLP